ncbi:hypothetical protein BaRGS_00007941, partial [Batillaria attramentaria]
PHALWPDVCRLLVSYSLIGRFRSLASVPSQWRHCIGSAGGGIHAAEIVTDATTGGEAASATGASGRYICIIITWRHRPAYKSREVAYGVLELSWSRLSFGRVAPPWEDTVPSVDKSSSTDCDNSDLKTGHKEVAKQEPDFICFLKDTVFFHLFAF